MFHRFSQAARGSFSQWREALAKWRFVAVLVWFSVGVLVDIHQIRVKHSGIPACVKYKLEILFIPRGL